MEYEKIGELTLNQLCETLKDKYKFFESKKDILTLHKLIQKLSRYDNCDFGKLRIKEIESKREYKYFLLDCSHPNAHTYMLYKDIIDNRKKCL